MGINRFQNSLTSCRDNPEFYDDKYQLTRRPDLKSRESEESVFKDTIKRSASTDALNLLQRPSENMIAQPNILFSRIGKYVFLTVAMPPYFLLYALPKWLLVEGFHLVVMSMSWLQNATVKHVKKPAQMMKQKVNQLVFFMQMFIKRMIQPIAALKIQLQQFFQKMMYRFGKINEEMFSKLREILKKPSKSIKKLQNSLPYLSENLKKRFENAKNLIKTRALALNEKIVEGTNWMQQLPQLFLGWGNAPLQYLNTIQEKWTKKFAAKLKISSQAAQLCSDWVGKQLGKLNDFGKKILQPLGLVFKKTVKPIFHVIGKNFSSAFNKLSNFLNDRKKRSLEFLEKLQCKIKILTPQQVIDKLLPSSFLSKLPVFLRKLLLKIKENSLILSILNLGIKGIAFVVSSSTKSLKGVSNMQTHIVDHFKLLSDKIKLTFDGILTSIHHAKSLVQKGCKNGLHGSLVVIFMAGILLKWGFESLSETTAKWIAKVSFFSRKAE